MRTHYLLAKVYSQNGEIEKAQEHFDSAQVQLYEMAQAELPTCLLAYNEKDFDYWNSLEKKLEKHKSRLMEVAEENDFDTFFLSIISTSTWPRTGGLTKSYMS